MNRHSLIVYISIFFLFLMGVINTLFYFQYRYEQEDAVENAFKKFKESREIMHMGRQKRLPFEVTSERLQQILHVEVLRKEDAGDFQKGRLLDQRKHLRAYLYNGMIYIHFKDSRRAKEQIIRFKNDKLGNKKIFLFALAIDLSVMLFFLYVIRRIWPLRELKESIARFSQGDLDIHTAIKGRDEIAEVANEFDHAISKIKQLQGSRNLFLRNIMHELKTPIAKGKLITDLLDDEKNAERLSLIFSRFEHLLGEFAKIERVTSNEFILNKKRFRVVDIVDNALDILMLEHDALTVTIEAENEIDVDFELFSVAIKNLIDNAIKYAEDPPNILIQQTQIAVISTGDALDSNILDQVFNRKFEDSSKGLGLGLYITKNIVEKHGFRLEYLHVNEENHFIIHI
jgi:signal transduction histidine kinase